jgi:hypothetical protein
MKTLFASAACFAFLLATASAETYRVGPTEEITKLSAIADKLEPGDLVEITGDITDSVILRNSGTAEAPIVIRGVTEKMPIVDFAGARNGIEIRGGDYYTLEHLDLRNASGRGIFLNSGGNVVRDCYFKGNHNGIMGADSKDSGDILIEYCEFDGNGSGNFAHQIYLASFKPGATAVVQFNYFHDSSGGMNVKSRMPRNVIRYNWIESAAAYECDIIDSDNGPDDLRPMHALFLGNVVVTNNKGNPHHQVNIASDQARSPGTKNTYIFVNNLFVCNRESHEIHMLRVGGEPASVGIFNNIFVGPDLKKYGVMCVENVNAEEGKPGTPGFVQKLYGSSNFASANADRTREELADWIRGEKAGAVIFATDDFSLAPESPCVGAGTTDAGVAPKYMPPIRAKMAPGGEVARPTADGIDLGPFGATVKDANDDPEWLGK